MGGAGLGMGTVVFLLLAFLMGGDPLSLLGAASSQQGPVTDPQTEQFVSVVLADTEEVWGDLFRQMGRDYQEPKLVLFRGRVDSACGLASSAVGPFYCPGDRNVFLDTSFFDQLSGKLGAPGDFAAAYVIAHEVGHHVQNLLGTMDRVRRGSGPESDSVRLELQADYYAGVWAHHAQRRFGSLEPGDLEEAIRAAGAVGDDQLQEQAQGHVVPDSFTHGTSEQRIRWFRKGWETGDPTGGDTFSVSSL